MRNCLIVFIASIALLFSLASAKDQKIGVQNISFIDKDDQILISYDLLGKPEDSFLINLRLSSDGGKTFSIQPKILAGEFMQVKPGTGKEISWSMYADFPEGLWGENFVFQIEVSRLKTKGKAKWPYYLGSATVLGGGAAYFLLSGGKEEKKEEKGTLIITVPDMP